MKRSSHLRTGVFLLAALSLLTVEAVSAQSKELRDAERGKREFMNYCAVCHGAEARGDGPLRPFLIKPPSDLTTLAQRHAGAFPTREVMQMIDGRDAPRIGSHGPREMPVWGDVFYDQAQQDPVQAKLHPEWSVRARITALIDYLRRLQVGG